MFRAAKDHACEVDTKLRLLRKKTANYACGFVQQDASKLEPARAFVAESQKSLEDIQASSEEFVRESNQLERLLVEADETADKLFARLSEIYADCGLEMPQIADDDLPVGIPLEKLTLQEQPEESSLEVESQDATNCSDSILSSELLDGDFVPNVFLTRPSDSNGPPISTPMIKTKKK